MSNGINYAWYFEKAYQAARSIYSPHSTPGYDKNIESIREQSLTEFSGLNYERIAAARSIAKANTVSCLKAIIINLFRNYNYEIEIVEVDGLEWFSTPISFSVLEKKSSTLFLFKEIEKSSLWIEDDSDFYKAISQEYNAKSIKVIFFMRDFAYKQIHGYNSDESDPGRGYNWYSMKWFIENYFGKDEYLSFIDSYTTFERRIYENLGVTNVKMLTPFTLMNFKGIVEQYISEYDYSCLLGKVVTNAFGKEFRLESKDYRIIYDGFFSHNDYQLLLGKSDFSESLITAEWLYDSMKKAEAVDLTVIGMGYFKAAEQLIYDVICLHKNQGRSIQKDYSRKELPKTIELNDENINTNAIDTTLGSMANFYKNNLDILNPKLSKFGKNYFKESLFAYSKMRNGYLHKDNIHDWIIINAIRESTFELLFLLIGSHVFTIEETTGLGLQQKPQKSDYYKLCEYVNYHCGDIFILDNGEKGLVITEAKPDLNSYFDEDSILEYSGVYFRPLHLSESKLYLEKDLPERVYLGTLEFPNSKDVKIIPKKEILIFEKGAFVGPSIINEAGYHF